MSGSQDPHILVGRRIFNSLFLRVRLLPILIGCATLMLMFRVYDLTLLLEGSEKLFGISELSAEPPDVRVKRNKGTNEIVISTISPPVGPDLEKTFDPLSLTAGELHVLENLSKRKQELDLQQADLDEREHLLLALERRVNEKVLELQKLKHEIEKLVQHHGETNTAKLKNLARIYELMPPKEAARMFSKMKLKVLLDVLGEMKDVKAAAILGKMDPNVALTVTEELAQQEKLTSQAKNQIKQPGV